MSNNPFKMIAMQPLSRRASEVINEKEVPDTPVVNNKYIAVINDGYFCGSNFRGSNFTSSDGGNAKVSRFAEDFIE